MLHGEVLAHLQARVASGCGGLGIRVLRQVVVHAFVGSQCIVGPHVILSVHQLLRVGIELEGLVLLHTSGFRVCVAAELQGPVQC